MLLPHITKQQKLIPTFLYKYRFLNRLHIQKLLHHKDKKTINLWLKDLVMKDYISRIYEGKILGANTKPAVFYIGVNGIRFLKTYSDCDLQVIQKLYREGSRQESFISRCLLLVDISLQLEEKSTGDTTYTVVTESEYLHSDSELHILRGISPDLFFTRRVGKRRTYYLLEYFDSVFSQAVIRNRIKKYREFLLCGTWEEYIGRTPPVLLFICPSVSVLIYAKRLTKRLFEEGQLDGISIRFTTTDEIKRLGITGDVWEDVIILPQ